MNWDEPKTIYVAVALGLVALRYMFELWLDHLLEPIEMANQASAVRCVHLDHFDQ